MKTETTAFNVHTNRVGHIEIVQLPCLADNYCAVIRDHITCTTLVVDTPDANRIEEYITYRGWSLDYILTTHHHWDHIDGHLQLKQKYDCRVVGAVTDNEQIPGLDITVSDGSELNFGEIRVCVIETPGHTLGHLCYWLPEARALFAGDTLFSLGCGRLFEGTPKQMWNSLLKIKALPTDTMLYSGHEYTASNGVFAQSIAPENKALHDRITEVKDLREKQQPTLPVLLQQELRTNPFLRADSKEIKRSVGLENSNDYEVFARIRQLKDQF